jgi:hypothetical protein
MTKVKLAFLMICMAVCILQVRAEVVLRITSGGESSAVNAAIEKNTSRFLTELENAAKEGRLPDFKGIAISQSAQEKTLQTWQQAGAFFAAHNEIALPCINRAEGGYAIQGVAIKMSNDKGLLSESQLNQEFTFIYTATGVIEKISVVGENRQITWQADADVIKDEEVLTYVENFLTVVRDAYNHKDIKTIEKVYGDSAIIVSGTIIKVVDTDNRLQFEKIKYVKQNKVQYIRKLRNVFNNNQKIDIVFGKPTVKRHPRRENLFSVSFLQNWRSTRYSDDGYLTLIIDFAYRSQPVIHFRLWLPETLNGVKLKSDEIIDVNSIKIN